MPSQGMAADAFEAYIGALWTEHADRPKVVREWLETLWSPKVFPTLKGMGNARNPAYDGKKRKRRHFDENDTGPQMRLHRPVSNY